MQTIVTGLNNCITDVYGIKVGHYTDLDSATGCTVIMCEDGAIGGVATLGSFPGSRETTMLSTTSVDSSVHSILLTGGSIFGLDAASGIVKWLEEHKKGLRIGRIYIPRVPGAVIFDLGYVTHKIRPSAENGYVACENATASPALQGTVGAGTGGTVGKLTSVDRAMKGGFGTASIELGDGLIVGAAIVTNSIGGIYDPVSGKPIAGPIAEDGSIIDSLKYIISDNYTPPNWISGTNTTIGVVATNGIITTAEANKLSMVAHDGLAISVRPSHMQFDGDTLFAIGTGTCKTPLEMSRMCAAVSYCVAEATVNSVLEATSLAGICSVKDMI